MLGASGHIAGVVNPPEKNRRNYWTNRLLPTAADDWLARRAKHARELVAALGRLARAAGRRQAPAPRAAGSADNPPLDPAPGRYVLESSG